MKKAKKYYVYKYYIKGKLVYIGQTQVDPYDRYRQHVLEETRYAQIDEFELLEVPTEIDMCLLETYLIAKNQPPWNIKDTNKSIPTFKLLYNDNFIKYTRDQFIRTFKKVYQLPYSRSKLKEISKYKRLDDNNIYTLDFLNSSVKHFTYKNHIITLEYDKKFIDAYLNYFNIDNNYYFKVNKLDTSKILNSYIKIENINTGNTEKIYFVENIDSINKEFYSRCTTKEEISDIIFKITKGVEKSE